MTSASPNLVSSPFDPDPDEEHSTDPEEDYPSGGEEGEKGTLCLDQSKRSEKGIQQRNFAKLRLEAHRLNYNN